MDSSTPIRPSLHEIGQRQVDPDNLLHLAAATHFYHYSKRLYLGGAALAIVIALAAPVVLLFQPSWGPTLGAIGALWVFASRLWLEPFRQSQQQLGARAHEEFDCAVFGLPWNATLADAILPEDRHRVGTKRLSEKKLRNWYPTEANAKWPHSVLICQRGGSTWALRQHREYRRLLLRTAVAWVVGGISVAIWQDSSLSAYLTTIALPSLPALLDAVDHANQHKHAAAARERVEAQLHILLKTTAVGVDDIREVQDQLFGLRVTAPIIPEWFYRLRRSSYERDMQFGANASLEQLLVHQSQQEER